MKVYDLVSNTPYETFIVIKCFKTGSDVSGIKNAISTLSENPDEALEELNNIVSSNMSNLVDKEYWKYGKKVGNSKCEYIWILPIVSIPSDTSINNNYNQNKVEYGKN